MKTLIAGVLLLIVACALKADTTVKNRYGQVILRERKGSYYDYYGRRQFQVRQSGKNITIHDKYGRRIP